MGGGGEGKGGGEGEWGRGGGFVSLDEGSARPLFVVSAEDESSGVAWLQPTPCSSKSESTSRTRAFGQNAIHTIYNPLHYKGTNRNNLESLTPTASGLRVSPSFPPNPLLDQEGLLATGGASPGSVTLGLIDI